MPKLLALPDKLPIDLGSIVGVLDLLVDASDQTVLECLATDVSKWEAEATALANFNKTANSLEAKNEDA